MAPGAKSFFFQYYYLIPEYIVLAINPRTFFLRLFFANLFGHFLAREIEKSISSNIPERIPYLEK